MRSAILGFAAGVFYLQNQATLPDWNRIGLLALLALLLLTLRWRRLHHPAGRVLAGALCGALLGVAWSAALAQHYLAQELPSAWEGRDITLVGIVDSLPQTFEKGVRFQFTVEHVLPQQGQLPTVPTRLSLSWYTALAGAAAPTEHVVQPGERWQLTVRLKKPHGNANPHGFDYEAWLLEQQIRATGYVRADAGQQLKNQRLKPFVPSAANLVERARSALRQRIFDALPAQPYAGVIAALVIGDQRAVNESDWKIFNRTGISHLISISGLHITMIAGLFAGLVFWLWRHSLFIGAALPLYLPAQKAAALAGVLVALLYVLLAGFGVPAQRTLYMISVVALALWSGRLTSVSHVLCVALALVLLLDPWAVLWPGFWLSFAAVGAILYTTVGRARQPSPATAPLSRLRATLGAAAHTQYVITVALVPLTLLLFAQVSLVSPIANAIAIPVVSLLVTPLALIGSVLPAPLAHPVLTLAHALVQWLAFVMTWLDQLPWAVWRAPMPDAVPFVLALAGTGWLLAPRGWPARWLGLFCWLPLLLNAPARPPAAQLWLTVFDVGQGSAVLLETAQHRLLYDAGPSYSAAADAGSRVIVPYLQSRGIGELDTLLITHHDSDHAGGALAVLGSVRVARLLSSLAATHPIVRAAPLHQRCIAGQNWDWDGVHFELLQPLAADYEVAGISSNALSCVLKVSVGQQAVLLTGDIGVPQELRLLQADAGALRANVLLVPHHGSATSSSPAFLAAVQPQLALFQLGYRNRYHHPQTQVYARYQELGIARLRSDEAGAITLQLGVPLQAHAYRRTHQRYWYGR